MKRFVVPPNWPSPPRRNWVPPKSWHPDPSWPPAPEGWRFWVDGKGYPVVGPVGRYGAPSRRTVYAGASALIVFTGVSVWALLATGLFGGGRDDSAAVKFTDRASASPTVAAGSTTPAVPRTTTIPTGRPTGRPTGMPTGSPTSPVPSEETRRPTERSTERPTRKPTATRTTERRTSTPTPTRTTTRAPSPRPSRPTSSPSTRDELLRQYCIQQGIDPAWCDPSIWQNSRDR